MNIKLPGATSRDYHGYQLHAAEFKGTTATIIEPAKPNADKKFLWKGFYLDAFPAFDLAALEAGYYVVHVLCSKDAPIADNMEIWNRFYGHLTGALGFRKKAVLFGLSRGGWFIYQWAAANPDKVSCMYADNPLCDARDEILAPLAYAGVPVLHVAATEDTVVPYEKNTALVAERYKALGGSIEVMAHAGDHHPHGLVDPTPMLEFIARHI